MGTLTANSQRLPDSCEHKLPTSCRLFIPKCCACADDRQHSRSYTIYIDGVGLVSRGTRWQRYCWFCKEFWSNRVAATNLTPAQSEIPERPDQTEFLAKWYEFYQGYRVVKKDDGTEEHIAVLGEPFKDVEPGRLPRTLDELRSGLARSTADPQQHIEVAAPQTAELSSDEEVDNLFADQEQEASPPARRQVANRDQPSSRIAGNVMQPVEDVDPHHLRHIAMLRQYLAQMRESVNGVVHSLGHLGAHLPTSLDAIRQLALLEHTLRQLVNDDDQPERDATEPTTQDANIDARIAHAESYLQSANSRRLDAERRLDELRRHVDLAQASVDQAEDTLRQAETRESRASRALQRHRQERQAVENYRRVFGTREDVEGRDWVSPLTSMFNRAYGRYQAAEEERRTHQAVGTQQSWNEADAASQQGPDLYTMAALSYAQANAINDVITEPPATPDHQRLASAAPLRMTVSRRGQRQRGLDIDPERPPPRPDEELTVHLGCKVCFAQQADVACMPCGHLVMCRWCSEQVGRTGGPDGTQPREREYCSVCRVRVTRKIKITIC